MQHSLTHAPIFMHGEPEPSYSLRLFNDVDRISLKEMEAMERLHRELALQRQMQQEDRSSQLRTGIRRPCSSQLPIAEASFRSFGTSLPQHEEDPDDLVIGAARRLDHIIDDRKTSRRVVPTASNKQYPVHEYLYARKGEGYKGCTPPPGQDLVFTNTSNNSESNYTLASGASTLKIRGHSNVSMHHRMSSSHTNLSRPENGAELRRDAPLLVVTSPKATRLNWLSVQSPMLRSAHTPTTPFISSSPAKSLKSPSAWVETLPSIANVEYIASLTPVRKPGADARISSSLTEPSDELKGLALSPGTSCTLTFSN